MTVQKKELIKKILFVAIAFLGYYLGISLNITGLSLFLANIGPSKLPPIMILSAGVFLVFSFLNLILSKKIRVDHMFSFIMVFFVGVFTYLQNVGMESYLGIVITIVSAILLVNVMSLNFVKQITTLITPLQAKTYLPLVNGFVSLAIITGSLGIKFFESITEKIGIGYFSIAILVVILLLNLILQKLFGKEFAHKFSEETDDDNLWMEMKSAISYVLKKSTLFRLIALVFFLIVGIKVLTEFRLNTVLEGNFDEEHISSMLGVVFAIQNSILIVLNFFILKKAMFKFGVSNVLIFYPLAYLFGLILALVMGLDYRFVILVSLIELISYHSYVAVSLEQMMSIADKKQEIMVFNLIKGFIVGFSLLLFSSLLLIFTYRIDLEGPLNSVFLLVLAIALLWAALKIKKLYFNELKTNLFKQDDVMRSKAIDLLAEKAYKETGENLLRKLIKLDSMDFQIKSRAIYSIGIIGNYQSLSDLIYVIENGNPKEKFAAIEAVNQIVKSRRALKKYPVSKYLLLQVYDQLLLSDVSNYVKIEIIDSLKYFNLMEVIHFLEEHLKSEDTAIRTNIIETLGIFNDRAIITYLRPFLDDKDLFVVCATIMSLWKFKGERINLMPKFTAVLMRKDDQGIKAALYVIGMINAYWEKDYVEDKLRHSSSEVRQMAILTLIKLGEIGYIDDLVNELLVEMKKKHNDREVAFVLSVYRKLDQKYKKQFIHKVQNLAEEDVKLFLEAFKNSNYLFGMEQAELS